MRVKTYKNFKKAIEAIFKKDKDYIFVKHVLKAGEKIKLHYHKKANEWILIDSGNFKIKIGKEERLFNLNKKITAIYLPLKTRHSLAAISKISYLVFRDKKDKTYYVKNKIN